MEKFCYDNIDLFYYHSIDFDFSRFVSILEHGILSKNAALEEKLPYYYRNYIKSSTRNNYVSVNHFPRTIFRYFQIENELYDFNTHKICFVIDDIDALEKQSCKNRHAYTNERHVFHKIEKSSIKGIILREIDAQKLLSEIPFNYRYTDKEYFENKVFATISFFTDTFGSFGETNKIYFLIGKLREARIKGCDDTCIMELISKEMKKNINLVMNSLLEMESPTLLDAINFFNNNRLPIYIMNKFDIQLANHILQTTDWRMEKFRESSNDTKAEMKLKKSIDKNILQFLKKMSDEGVDIYFGYKQGPFIESDSEIVEEIQKLSFTKK